MKQEYSEFIKAYAEGNALQIHNKVSDTWADISPKEYLYWFSAPNVQFRVKPASILINGIEVPKQLYTAVDTDYTITCKDNSSNFPITATDTLYYNNIKDAYEVYKALAKVFK